MITRQGRLPSTTSSVLFRTLPGGPARGHRHHDRLGARLDRLAHDAVAGLVGAHLGDPPAHPLAPAGPLPRRLDHRLGRRLGLAAAAR